MSRVPMVAILISLLIAGCAQRDERHPIAIAIAGTPAPTTAAPHAPASPTASAQATLSAEDAMAKFTQCLRQNGIDAPDPGSAEARTWRYTGDRDTFQKAMKACESFAAQLPNPLDDPKMRDQMVQFARCMREQGIDMPDPPRQNPELDPFDPELQKAAEACTRRMTETGGER